MPKGAYKRTPRHNRSPHVGNVRPCMCCRKPFPSEWIGNRLCAECKKSSISGGLVVPKRPFSYLGGNDAG